MKAARPYPIVTITPKGERAIVDGHPWVYEGEVVSVSGTPEDGGLADVVSKKGSWLGCGFYNSASKIRVRLVTRNANDDPAGDAFWERRLRYAWDYRKTVMGEADSRCCRIIFGEADGFPGLTVDRFERVLVAQVLSLGMERIKERVLPLLVRILREDGQVIRGVYERNDAALRTLEGMAQGGRHLRCAGQNNVSTCFPQGIQQPGRGFRLHGGPVFKLPAFQLLRALSLQPFHVLPAFVSARTGMVGHDAGDALVRHGVPQVLQAAGHFQHAGKILRHGAWKQAGIKAVRRFPQGQEPPGQFFRSGRRFFLFFHPGELVCRNDLGSKDGLCTGNGGKVFPQLPSGFPCGNQHQMPVEAISQGKQAFRYSTAGRFVPG